MPLLELPVDTLSLAALGASTVLLSLFALNKWKTPNPKLPPGPPRKWIIGNALDVPTEQEWIGWDRLKREYGPLVSLKVFGQLIVEINDPQMVIQLLEKRSSVTSGRPTFVLSGKMSVLCMSVSVWHVLTRTLFSLEFEKLVIGSQHHAAHKEGRRLFNQTIGKGQVHKYEIVAGDEMIKMVGRLMVFNGDKDELVSIIRQ
jgi:Cytochrome P450